jgi:hypothetical protein
LRETGAKFSPVQRRRDDEDDPVDLAELVYESVKDLPQSAAQEVLDFAHFLAQRQASREDRNLMLAQQSALADWENSDDDAWNDAPAV